MKRIIMSVAVLAIVGGLMAGTAEARGSRGGSRGASHVRHASHGGHGHARVVHGSYRTFPRGYHNWGRVQYNARYRCNCYFDVGANGWFYYYAPRQCYLPVRLIATYPPTVTIINNVGVPRAAAAIPGPMPPPMASTIARPGL